MIDNPAVPAADPSAALPGLGALGASDSSLASRLRAHAEKLAVETKRFDLPGWGGQLQVEVRRLNRRDSRLVEGAQGVSAALQLTIAVATVSIIVRDGGDEQVFTSWPEFGQALMGAPDGTSASEVVGLVLPADQLSTQLVEEMGEWSRGLADVEDDELGK